VVLEIIHQIFRCRNRRWVEYKGIKLYIYIYFCNWGIFIYFWFGFGVHSGRNFYWLGGSGWWWWGLGVMVWLC
jgi:hypothetical protein